LYVVPRKIWQPWGIMWQQESYDRLVRKLPT
jgi:hypothetical protein